MPGNLLSEPSPQEIVVSSFRLFPTAIVAVGDPTIEQWEDAGKFINEAEKSVHFWIGDWLNYGEAKWGERYAQALDATRFDYGTLRNDKWVASRVAPERRRPQFTFDHHYSVADLSEDEQEILLDTAVRENLNRDEFRKYVRTRELPFKDQSLSRAHDKRSPVQHLIDAVLATERQITLLDLQRTSPEEREALTAHAGGLSFRLTAFLRSLEAYADANHQDPGNDL